MPDRMSEDMSDKMSEDILNRISEDLLIRKYIDTMVGIIRNKIIKLLKILIFIKYILLNFKFNSWLYII